MLGGGGASAEVARRRQLGGQPGGRGADRGVAAEPAAEGIGVIGRHCRRPLPPQRSWGGVRAADGGVMGKPMKTMTPPALRATSPRLGAGRYVKAQLELLAFIDEARHDAQSLVPAGGIRSTAAQPPHNP